MADEGPLRASLGFVNRTGNLGTECFQGWISDTCNECYAGAETYS